MSKKVLITAGASGIGKAMANAFHKKGYDIWIVDVDKAMLKDFFGNLESKPTGKYCFFIRRS